MQGRKKIYFLAIVAAGLVFLLGTVSNALSNRMTDWPSIVLLGVAILAIVASAIIYERQRDLEVEKPEPQPPGQAAVAPSQQPAQPSADPSRSEDEAQSGGRSRKRSLQSVAGRPSEEEPALLCLLIDVSHSMRSSLLSRTGDLIKQRTDLRTVFEHFVDLSVALLQDPQTQEVLPLYDLMIYGYGFKETAKALALRKRPGGTIRDWLAHSTLPALPSASELYTHWDEYRKHMLSAPDYTADLFGSSPMHRALEEIRDRIRSEMARHSFARPILLTIISDGAADDGDPGPVIDELHSMGVLTLCCYVGNSDVLAAKRLYEKEDAGWPKGVQRLFRCASPLTQDSVIEREMFAYLKRTGWHPREGARWLTQINQTEALDRFLNVLLSGLVAEGEAEES